MKDEFGLKDRYSEESNSRVFYKISFSIKANAGHEDLDLLWEIVCHIRKWLTYKEKSSDRVHVPHDTKRWSFFKNGCKIQDTKKLKTFYADSIKRINPTDEKDISWACRIRECEHVVPYTPRWWTTEIGFQTMCNSSARFSIVVSYADAMGFIGECLPTPSINIPHIVMNVQRDSRWTCNVYDDPLLFKPIEQKAGDGMKVRELLYDPERGIPIILIMPQKNHLTSEIEHPVDPQKMITSVAGNALVYYSCDMEFVEEFRYLVNEKYRCTAGMIRCYLPNIDINNESDMYRHRYISYDDAIAMGEGKILDIFRRVLSQDINDDDRVFRYRECQELLRRDKLQEHYSALLKKRQEDSEREQGALNQKLERTEIKAFELEIKNMDLENELKNAKKENYRISSERDSIRALYEPLRIRKDAFDHVRELSNYPNDPKTVFEFFSTVFSDRIAVTERGWKSLKECKTDPEILWNVLYSMVKDLYDCIAKYESFTEACQHYNERSRYECVPGNTSATKKDKDIKREYLDIYNGDEISIEPHLKSNTGKESDPRFFRIYFNTYTIPKNGKKIIVIGWCGGHLTTAGTMKRK